MTKYLHKAYYLNKNISSPGGWMSNFCISSKSFCKCICHYVAYAKVTGPTCLIKYILKTFV